MELRPQKIRTVFASTEEGWKETTPLCESHCLSMIHHKCRTAMQSLKEFHAFGKSPALALTSLHYPILEKETADQAGIWLFRDDLAPPDGLSITHHHPMRMQCALKYSRNVVLQTSEWPISYSQCPWLTPNSIRIERRSFPLGGIDWCACPK
jgi:hypothetical protein